MATNNDVAGCFLFNSPIAELLPTKFTDHDPVDWFAKRAFSILVAVNLEISKLML
jgi:hypothetical protein